jgi:UDP-glucose:glycoprotein glucosyltransferase
MNTLRLYIDTFLTINSYRQIKDLPFDRTVIGNFFEVGTLAILYADPTSPSFGRYHDVLSKKAAKGELSYRVRYQRSDQAPNTPLPVNGYGVELALKRTDYIVIDDRESSKAFQQKPIAADIVLDEQEEVADLKPLSTAELTSLGLKTASFILKSENPLEALLKTTQDFPKFSASIAAHELSEDFVAEKQANAAAGVPSGINFLWMNGVQLIERQIEPFQLVDMIRRERKLINGLRRLGLNGKQAIALLRHPKIAESQSEEKSMRFDWTDRTEEGKVIAWLNDLENDARYASFPKDLMSVCMEIFPRGRSSSSHSSCNAPILANYLRWDATSFMSLLL